MTGSFWIDLLLGIAAALLLAWLALVVVLLIVLRSVVRGPSRCNGS